MATQDNRTPKIRRKSAAVPVNFDPIRERLDAQISRVFQARSVVRSVQALVDDQEEGCDSSYALDVVLDILKGVAAELSEANGALHAAAAQEVAHHG
jgi:hypothetical protein